MKSFAHVTSSNVWVSISIEIKPIKKLNKYSENYYAELELSIPSETKMLESSFTAIECPRNQSSKLPGKFCLRA